MMPSEQVWDIHAVEPLTLCKTFLDRSGISQLKKFAIPRQVWEITMVAFYYLGSHMASSKFTRTTFTVSRTILIAVSVGVIGLESFFVWKTCARWCNICQKKYGFLVQSWQGSSGLNLWQDRANSSKRQQRWLRSNRKSLCYLWRIFWCKWWIKLKFLWFWGRTLSHRGRLHWQLWWGIRDSSNCG